MWLKLIQVMNEKKISGKQLAEKTGFHVMTISQYRTGKRSPNMKVINQLAEAIGVEARELV